jgi:isopentenyldiphosphate isomerase
MSKSELFDIFDSQMLKIGVDSRENVHAKGLWHQTFHCWIVNMSTSGGGSLLFQLRHKDKDTYPLLLDISCAGHLLSGETVEDGVRELKEELGITLSIEELNYCGMAAEESIISKDLIDREFNHVFIHYSDKALEEYDFQLSEISGLFFINIKQFQQLLRGQVNSIMTEGIILDELNQKKRSIKRKVNIDDFTPNSDRYYQLLFEKLQSMEEFN